MKLFRPSNIDVIEDCRDHFEPTLPRELSETRSQSFFNKYTYNCVISSFCKLFVRSAIAYARLLIKIDN